MWQGQQQDLTWVTERNQFGMRVESAYIVGEDERGRKSIRIQSIDQYSKGSMFVLDLAHMPQGCGTWPAYWSNGQGDWPNGGEIDFIEGTNSISDDRNRYTIHTGFSSDYTCAMTWSNKDQFTGSPYLTNCQGSAGCNVIAKDGTSFGVGLNRAGGGWHVFRWDDLGMSFWWFPRNAGNTPSVLTGGSDTINDDDLGMPDAIFPDDQNCDMSTRFTPQNIIFDTTLCGSWSPNWDRNCGNDSGNRTWGCPNLVRNYPSQFKQAYWLINSLKIYTQ
ncbi:hypothetical protein VHUM_04215 [Vanrija humicola]|uniref:GH16 domain-containing protein n=1 Tax=Vanrija humicola TaxID=5417 RepID=A0A7D8Z034_VANHU|nr:hypothetical protein VHUM_04215 [Vanrija humicola]